MAGDERAPSPHRALTRGDEPDPRPGSRPASGAGCLKPSRAEHGRWCSAGPCRGTCGVTTGIRARRPTAIARATGREASAQPHQEPEDGRRPLNVARHRCPDRRRTGDSSMDPPNRQHLRGLLKTKQQTTTTQQTTGATGLEPATSGVTVRGSNTGMPCISRFLPLVGHRQVTVSIFECIGRLKSSPSGRTRVGIIPHKTDIACTENRTEPTPRVPADPPPNLTVVLTNPDQDCSPGRSAPSPTNRSTSPSLKSTASMSRRCCRSCGHTPTRNRRRIWTSGTRLGSLARENQPPGARASRGRNSGERRSANFAPGPGVLVERTKASIFGVAAGRDSGSAPGEASRRSRPAAGLR